jgi:hypothetical protein
LQAVAGTAEGEHLCLLLTGWLVALLAQMQPAKRSLTLSA